MRRKRLFYLCVLTFVFSSISVPNTNSQMKELKIGVLYSMTGPLAGGGGIASYRGTMLAIDAINDQGGVMGKYKIVPIVADTQSSPDIAVREMERLISIEDCPIIIGEFSSAICIPCAVTAEKNKRIWWNSVCISDGVLQDKHFQYAFRPGPFASTYGRNAVKYVYDSYKKLGFKDPKEIKIASLTEDGPYGSAVRSGTRAETKNLGVSLVFDESYSHTTSDMSAIILRAKASGQNVICHAGYAPDIILFNKQARELGLKTKAIVGEGTMYADNEAMAKVLGKEATNYLLLVDILPLQLMNKEKASPENAKVVTEFSERALKKYNDFSPVAHYSFSFSATWLLGKTVLPMAIQKYGDPSPESVRKICTELDIPDGQFIMPYGVKFEPPASEFAGQNVRASLVMMQWIDGKLQVISPEGWKTAEAVLPMPATHPLGQKQ